MSSAFSIRSIAIGSLIGSCSLILIAGSTAASEPNQVASPTPMPTSTPLACNECHLDINNAWSASSHAQAFDGETFQDRWRGMGQPGECLTCHTTGYQTNTGHYNAAGVTCESCHGPAVADHPPAIVSVQADTDYCGRCHPPTLSEWRLSAHAAAGVGCIGCHNPHSQGPLVTTTDEVCLNCHQKNMSDHEDLHRQKGVGCVECHAVVIPPDTHPADGLVATGHTFAVNAATCVACHTDTLHAGKALPGYEAGAASVGTVVPDATPQATESATQSETSATQQRIQLLEAALASRNLSVLFQGGLIGLVFGGATAWLVARNLRGRMDEPEAESSATTES